MPLKCDLGFSRSQRITRLDLLTHLDGFCLIVSIVKAQSAHIVLNFKGGPSGPPFFLRLSSRTQSGGICFWSCLLVCGSRPGCRSQASAATLPSVKFLIPCAGFTCGPAVYPLML